MARNNFEDRDNCEAKLVIANLYFFNLKSRQRDKEISFELFISEFCFIVFGLLNKMAQNRNLDCFSFENLIIGKNNAVNLMVV